MYLFIKKHLSSFRIIIVGFALVILMGAILLMMPFASKGAGGTSFLDALFTSTSAVCVTGLIVHDTATYWTLFGKIIIICLIQIGGLGVVTIAVSITMFSGRKIGLVQRSTLQDAISAPSVGGIVRLTSFILKITFATECIGAALLSLVFVKRYGVLKGIGYGIFHSISAFCNAGFDLMGVEEKYSSLCHLSDNWIVNLTIAGLIIFGGIGFLTWEDIKSKKWKISRYRMQTKVILSMTACLLILPTIYFYFTEFSKLQGSERFLVSFFQAVTPRTAGFNTADLTRMSENGIFVIIILMLIGGSPGSTAGGMKTTTLAVLLSSTISVFLRQEDAKLYKRRIEASTVHNASAILNMYLILFLCGGMIISRVEGLPLLVCLFETASAVGTVGLTLGITPDLCILSKCILILLMFLGRVGGLTLIFATFSNKKKNGLYPMEKITVG